MKKQIIIMVLLTTLFNISYGQKDSLKVNFTIGLRGQWSTGTFSQFILNPSTTLNLENKHFRMDFSANYELLQIPQGELVYDFWVHNYYQFNPNKLFYPTIVGITGFAKSYQIDYNLTAGVGLGINIIKRKPFRYFQASLYGAFFGLKHAGDNSHLSPSANGYLKLQ
jgi:hypothetical protein